MKERFNLIAVFYRLLLFKYMFVAYDIEELLSEIKYKG